MTWLSRITGVDKLQATIDEQNKKIEELQKPKEEVKPRLDIISEGVGPDGNVRLEMEWNAEMITHLREKGYTGNEDEDVVNDYLNSIMLRFARPEMVNNGIEQLENERDDT